MYKDYPDFDHTKPHKVVNGVPILLNSRELEELAEREREWAEAAPQRELEEVYQKRKEAYGTVGEQLDMIYHHGIDIWKLHIEDVKARIPKPGK